MSSTANNTFADRISPELIHRYSTAIPRYTSYPTAVHFHPSFSNVDWERELAASSESPGLDAQLYVHLPFCPSLCYFCACSKVITQDHARTAEYLEVLGLELRRYAEVLRNPVTVRSLHWGGGSPNFLRPAEMRALLELLKSHLPLWSSDAELSVELDPRETTEEQLETLRDLGFSRLSFGVQDFDSKVQEAINRAQTYDDTARLCSRARALGFSGVNVDLLYGLPLQTRASFEDTIERVTVIRPDRIALYGYAHVNWLHKVQGVFHKLPRPSPEERVELFLCALRRLSAAGYEYIGIDHFALPEDSLARARSDGTLHRNFMGYTSQDTAALFAFGMSSISCLPAAFAQNEKHLDDYQRRVRTEGFAIERGCALSDEDRIRGSIIKGLFCRDTVDLAPMLSGPGASELLRELRTFEDDGLAVISGGRVTITPLGRLFTRNMASLFDAYIAQAKAPGKPVFSQSI